MYVDRNAAKVSATPVTDGLPRERRRWAVAAIFTALAMASLDTAIANIALPAISAELHVSPAQAVWVVNVYQIALVATLLPLGALGEIVGHQRIYLGGLVLFTLASLGCALAWSLDSLLVARTLQGLGASGVMSVNTALVRFVYPSRMHGRGFGHNALVVATAFTFGPTIASGILAVGSWPWLFAINIPFGVVAILIGMKTLPATPRSTHKFDFPGALLARGASDIPLGGRDGARSSAVARLSACSAACRSPGADAAGGPVPAAAVCAVGGNCRLLIRGAGARLCYATLLFRGRPAPLSGRDRLLPDAVAAGGRDHGADRRPIV